jgi:hypothetical protein
VPALSPARSSAAVSHKPRATRNTEATVPPGAAAGAHPGDEQPMSREEAAKFLGYSIHTMNNLAVLGKGPHYTGTGKKTFYFKSQLLAWVRSLPSGGSAT